MLPSERKKLSSPDRVDIPLFRNLTTSSEALSIHAFVLSPSDRHLLLKVDTGLCSLPPELTLEIISCYQAIDHFTRVQEGPHRKKGSNVPPPGFILSSWYQERCNALRALCGTCKTYRSIFLPILWDRLNICFPSRRDDPKMPFHRAIGDAMLRKCKGILENQNLAAMVRTVNVIFTRHRMEITLPAFAQCLRTMPNLRTVHVLDANPHMPNAIRSAFKGLTLPSVRTLIIPGTCHELLKHCPDAVRVWCTQGNGNKFVTVISKFCKQVSEVRGFRCEENSTSMKRLVKGIPNLRVLEFNAPCSEDVLQHLPMLDHLVEIDVRIPRPGAELEDEGIQRTIETIVSVWRETPSTKEKGLRLVHRSTYDSDAR